MKIAIIGTGNMAQALGRRLVNAQRAFTIAGREPGKARALAENLGSRATARGIGEAAREAEVLFLAVPFGAVGGVLDLAGTLDGKILVDIVNPLTPDMSGLTVGHTTSAAEEIQRRAPGSHVVKAFNTLFAHVVAAPAAGQARPQVFIAADRREAAASVAALADAMGFAAVYAGALANARYLEPLGMLNILLGYPLGHGTAISPGWHGLRAGQGVQADVA
jgi:predicted dinucleotide-binding enzyme